jgi:hypothetical protein
MQEGYEHRYTGNGKLIDPSLINPDTKFVLAGNARLIWQNQTVVSVLASLFGTRLGKMNSSQPLAFGGDAGSILRVEDS